MTEKLTITVPECAELLGISVPKMYELARSEKFPSFHVGRRLLINRNKLQEWIDAQSDEDYYRR